MRKQFKQKARGCALCKPHKRGWSNRWKPKQQQAMVEAERDVRQATTLYKDKQAKEQTKEPPMDQTVF